MGSAARARRRWRAQGIGAQHLAPAITGCAATLRPDLELERPAACLGLQLRLGRVFVGLDAGQLGHELFEQQQIRDVIGLELVGDVLEQPCQLDAREPAAQGAREGCQACG